MENSTLDFIQLYKDMPMSEITNIQPQKVLHLSKELDKKKPKLVGDYVITTKKNGWYVWIPFEAGKGWQAPLSSALRKIPAFEWIPEYLNKYASMKGRPYSFILIVEADIPELEFKDKNGLFNKTAGNYLCKDVVFWLHDLVVLGKQEETNLVRYNNAKKFYESVLQDLSCFRFLEPLDVIGYDQENWYRIFNMEVDKGEEGIVMKQTQALYMPAKRNSTLLKLKMECEKDLQALRLDESIGDKGNIGYTLISRGTNNVEIRTVINSHATQAALLKLVKENRLSQTVVQVKAMCEFENGSLKEPVFVCIRRDKTISEID